MITKSELHIIEMDLISMCEDNEVLKEAIINHFTNLMEACKMIPPHLRQIELMLLHAGVGGCQLTRREAETTNGLPERYELKLDEDISLFFNLEGYCEYICNTKQ